MTGKGKCGAFFAHTRTCAMLTGNTRRRLPGFYFAERSLCASTLPSRVSSRLMRKSELDPKVLRCAFLLLLPQARRPAQRAQGHASPCSSQLSGLWLGGRDCDFNPATFHMSEFLADEVKLVGALVDRTDHGPMLHRIVVPQLGEYDG